MVVLAPVVEPADPELHGGERAGPLVAAQVGEAFGGAGAEGGGGEPAGQHAALEHGVLGPVGGEQEAVHAPFDQGPFHMGAVAGVVPVRPVLVLDLHGHDGSAAAREQWQQLGDDEVEPAVDLGLETGVGAAQVEAVGGEEPGGQPAEVPFGADVRAGPDDGVQAEVAGGAQEAAEVAPAGEVGLARGGLVEVPGDVGVDGVDTEGAQPPQPVLPEVRMDPK